MSRSTRNHQSDDTCRACPKKLTHLQMSKGIKSCSRSCGAKRLRVWPVRKCRACPKLLTPLQVRKGIRSCSRSCGARKLSAYPKRICRVCPTRLTRDQVRRGNATCGRECAGLLQRATPRAVRHARAINGNAGREAKTLKRLVREIVRDCKPLAARIEDRALMHAIVKLVIRHRRIGYQRGWSANYMRRRRCLRDSNVRALPSPTAQREVPGTFADPVDAVLGDLAQRLMTREAGAAR